MVSLAEITTDSVLTLSLQTARIHSKHGLILDCVFECTNTTVEVSGLMFLLGEALKGRKYGFIERCDLGEVGQAVETHGALGDAWSWIRGEMSG